MINKYNETDKELKNKKLFEVIKFIIPLLFSVVSLIISYINYAQTQPHLVFHETDHHSYFRPIFQSEEKYDHSFYFSFVYVSLSNYSSLPLTIYKFDLDTEGYLLTACDSSTPILYDSFPLTDKDVQINKDETIELILFPDPLNSQEIINLPCTLEPYGHVEGYIFFPYSPKFENSNEKAQIKAYTTRGDYEFNLDLDLSTLFRKKQ